MIFTNEMGCYFLENNNKICISGLKNSIFNLNLKLELKLSIISFNNILNEIKNITT
jgi:hypothetical protein